MQHLDEGTIHAWIDGALTSDEAARVEAHVASCEECAAKLAEARGLVAASSRIVSALDVMPGGVLPAFGTRKHAWWRGIPMMAAAATVILAVGTIFTMREEPTVSSSSQLAKAPSSTPASPGTANASLSQPGIASVSPPPTSMRKRSEVVADRVERPAEPKASSAPAAAPAPVVAPAPSQALGSVMVTSVTDSFKPATLAADSMSRSESRIRMPAMAGGGRGASRAAGSFVQSLPLGAYPNASLIGCYQVNETTDVLPKQFALTTDPGGTNEVRYMDSTGVTSTPIIDLNWVSVPGRAMIRSPRGVILTIVRTPDSVVAQSILGRRTIVIIPCR